LPSPSTGSSRRTQRFFCNRSGNKIEVLSPVSDVSESETHFVRQRDEESSSRTSSVSSALSERIVRHYKDESKDQ
ncbi:unnamed protein product, partial [Amoebophrya sp. A25]